MSSGILPNPGKYHTTTCDECGRSNFKGSIFHLVLDTPTPHAATSSSSSSSSSSGDSITTAQGSRKLCQRCWYSWHATSCWWRYYPLDDGDEEEEEDKDKEGEDGDVSIAVRNVNRTNDGRAGDVWIKVRVLNISKRFPFLHGISDFNRLLSLKQRRQLVLKKKVYSRYHLHV